jgi:hypothetical protein
MEPHQQRVVDEYTELEKKHLLLKKFISGSPIYERLDNAEQLRLARQAKYMELYLNVLAERIAAF